MMSSQEIDVKVTEIKQLELEVKDLQAKIDELKESIKVEMDAAGIDEINTGTFVVKYADVVSNRFDTTRFKKDNADMYNQYLKESVSKRFTIK